MRDEIKSIADGVIESVKSFVSKTIEPLEERIDSLVFETNEALHRLDEKIQAIPAGEKGEAGADGRDGIDGKDGIGERGEKGEQGESGKDGRDGKDADEEAIIERCFAKILSSDVFMQKMAEFASAKVLFSIELPKDGRDGADGKDVDPQVIREMVQTELSAAVAAIPVPQNGKDGADGKDADESAIVEKVMSQIVMPQDGKSVTVDDVAPLIDELVTKRVAEIPAPKDGKDGIDGKDVDIEYVRSQIENAVAAIPKPENGKDADPQVIREMVLAEVAKIPVPADGRSITVEDVTPIMDVAVSRWALDFERRAQDVLQAAVERLPKPKDGEKGEPGNDGFGIEDFVQRGDRTVVAIYKRGDETIEQEFKFPAVIDRGVFKSGSDYEQGDGVTYGGSFWIAQKDTGDIPGNSDAWRLAVKRGRDGKDAA